MPDDRYDERGRGDDRDRGGDRDRDREKWDVKAERPSKNTIEAAEDVEGLLRVAWESCKDVFKEKATAEVAVMVYDRILAQREI